MRHYVTVPYNIDVKFCGTEKMRILLIVVYYPPSTTSAAQMMYDLAREFVRQGHQVMVVTPSSSIEGAVSIAYEDGVTVVRAKTGHLRSSNKILRLWRESRLSSIIWRKGYNVFLENPCDMIVFYSPSIFFGELVIKLKGLWGSISYLVHRDIFPQWAVDAGVIRDGGLLHRYLVRKELEQYAAATIIGVEAPGNLTYFNNGLRGKDYQTEVLYNWIGESTHSVGASGWRKKLGIEDKTIFFYGGNIGVAQDMDNIIRLATNLRGYPDLVFILIGDGSEVSRLHMEIERLDLCNIKMLPAIPQREYMQALSEADVGIVSLDKRLHSNNFTGKALGYLSCGKPILASVNQGNDLIEVLHGADAGIACINGDDETLRDAALFLATQPMVRIRMGQNARALGEAKFSVEAVASQILAGYRTAVDEIRSTSQK